MRARIYSAVRSDSGMSLVEVVVAIAILAILSTASLGVYLSSTSVALEQQRRQVAITIANESMEIVSGWSTSTVASTRVSALFTSRPKDKVNALWSRNSGVGGVTVTYPMWDPVAAPTTVAAFPDAIPLSREVTKSGTRFTAETLIGFCLQPIRGGNCVKLATAYNPTIVPAPAVPAGYTQLARAIVVVRWTAGCPAGGCFYATSTLIDLNSDLEWKIT
jgi:prepilin-type N-terminal cleavage/methylation domain-containing protein